MQHVPKSFGRSSARFEQLKRAQRAKKLPCFLCGQPIDYDLEYPHPDSFSVEHIIPRSVDPRLAEDPGNIQSSHLRCNQSRGNGSAMVAGLGVLSEDF